MYHNRTWSVINTETSEQVAKYLKQYQSVNFGVRLGKFLFLNDSTDQGISEYAVINEEIGVQVDSWTVEWNNTLRLTQNINALLKNPSVDSFPSFNDFDPSMVINVELRKAS